MEAAKLYNQGWAHEVWLTRTTLFSEDSGLAQPGIDRTPEHVYSRMVLRSEIRILRNRGGAIGETPLRCSSNVRCRPPRHVKNAIQNEAGPCAVAAVRHPPQPGTLRILPFGPAGQEATFHLGHVKPVASGARTAAGNLAIMRRANAHEVRESAGVSNLLHLIGLGVMLLRLQVQNLANAILREMWWSPRTRSTKPSCFRQESFVTPFLHNRCLPGRVPCSGLQMTEAS